MGSAQPPPVSLRVMVRADDLDGFVERYSHFIDGDRIFIFTKTAKAVGERLRFSLCLANGDAVLHGEGTVTRVQKDDRDPTRPPGMELRFKALDDSSQTLVDFLLATRADLAHGEEIVPPNLASPNVPSVKLELKTFLEQMKAQAPATPSKPATSPAPTPPQPSAGLAALSQAAAKSSLSKPAPSQPAPSQPASVPSVSASSASPAKPSAKPPKDFSLPVQSVPTLLGAPRPRRPTPAFADIHVVVPPAPGTIPANPFSQVSDNAIEYFVEWSLESSVGPHKESTASFSNVDMALPADDNTGEVRKPRSLPKWVMVLAGAGFAVGLTIGVVVGLTRKPAELPPRVVVVTEPAPAAVVVPSPEPVVVVAPPAAPPAAPRVVLMVRSRPSGAEVLLDGHRVGTTPLELPTSRGRHQLTLSHDRYSPTATDVQAPGAVDVPLQRPPAMLVVSASVPGATVSVAGSPRGNAPVRVRVRAYEKYNVEVSARGVSPWRRSVYVKAPSTEVRANLGVARR